MERAVSQPGNGRSRRGLQWTLAAVAVIPMASAVGEIVRGAQGVPGGSPNVPPTVDSSLRYANVFKFAMALMMWPQLGRVERPRSVTRSWRPPRRRNEEHEHGVPARGDPDGQRGL
jgi:hypothetical protein